MVDSKGRYKAAESDKKFNEQRNKYLLLMGELNKEGILLGDSPMDEETGKIKQAYSLKERNSFKSFTDMAYGYYDKDAQAHINNTWYGIIWLQFMQFWPGKMRQWFGKPISSEKSPIGDHIQKTRKKPDGSEVLLWRKPIYGDASDPEKVTDFDEVEEDTGDPAIGWVGSPQEGLAYSVLKTLHDVSTGDFKNAFGNKQRLNRVGFAVYDTILMMIIFGIIAALWKGFISENGDDGIEGSTAKFMYNINNKVLSEANVWQNTLGAIKSDPAFISFGQRLAKDMKGSILEDKDLSTTIFHNFKMFEYLDPTDIKE